MVLTSLRFRIDYMSVGAVVLGFGYSVVCCLVSAPLLFLFPLPLLSNWVHLVEHNHVHVPVFRNKRVNETLSWFLCLSTGIPVEGYRLHHVETHHRYAGTPQDWTSPYAYRGAQFPDRSVNLSWYMLTYAARAWRRGLPIMWSRRRTQQGKRFWRSMATWVTFSVVMGFARPGPFIAFFVAPWIGNALVPALLNWRHHRGCDFSSKFTGANVNLSILSRSLGFNIGYHSVHHEYPALHWSFLRERFIEEFASFTRPERVLRATRTRLQQAQIPHPSSDPLG